MQQVINGVYPGYGPMLSKDADFLISNFLTSPPSSAGYSPPDYNSDPSTGSGYQSPPSSLDCEVNGQLPVNVVDYLRKQQQIGVQSASLPNYPQISAPPVSMAQMVPQNIAVPQSASGFSAQQWMPPNLARVANAPAVPRVQVSHYDGMPWTAQSQSHYTTAVNTQSGLFDNEAAKRRKVTKPSINAQYTAPTADFMPTMPVMAYENSLGQMSSSPSDQSFVLPAGPSANLMQHQQLQQQTLAQAPVNNTANLTKNNKRRLSETRDEEEEVGPSGHNAVEKRYRTKINSSLTTLQSLIPALEHLRESDTPVANPSARRASAFILTTPTTNALPAGTKIDGVEAPNKLSKGIIIDKGIEYIRVLKRSRAELQQQLRIAESILDQIPQARAQYDHFLLANPPLSPDFDDTPSPPTRRAATNVHGNKRAMYGVIAGVGVLGTTGYNLRATNLTGAAQAAGTRAWTGASELAKRSFNVDTEPLTQSFTVQNAVSYLAVIAWLGVLAWYVGCGFGSFIRSGSFSTPSASSKRDAMSTLAAYEKAVARDTDVEHREVAAARQALLTLSGLNRLTYIGTLSGIMREGILSYLSSLGWRILYPTSAFTEAEMVERACALVRLAEIESAYKGSLCSLLARLYTCLRLHNLVRSSHWPSEEVSPPQLSRARVDATLALALVSVFSSQASGMSRRRRFWRTAIAEPKKAEAEMEPWVQVALGAEYEEACTAAFMPLGLPSPSDSIPLLRISEQRCSAVLRTIWSRMFVAMMHSFVATYDKTLSVECDWTADVSTDNDNPHLGAQLDNIVRSTVVGSPVHYMAMLTRGFWAMGVGQTAAARQVASYLALDAYQNGPSAHLIAVREYCRVVLPSTSTDEASQPSFAKSQPVNDLDALALMALKWVEIRRKILAVGLSKQDDELHTMALEARRCLNLPNIAIHECTPDFVTAQQVSVQLAEQIGRRALGLDQPETDTAEL